MTSIKNIITGSTILTTLKQGRVALPPLSFKFIESEPIFDGKYRFDALIEGAWNGSSIMFVAEIKAHSTPKAFMEGIALLKAAPLPKNRYPLLITPFLSEQQLQALEQEGINGLDLCGNGFFTIAGKLTVLRTGQPNRFSSNSAIKNIYRKNCSLVGRVFLSRAKFSQVNQILDEIKNRDLLNAVLNQPSLTQGTVSKVLAGMEQDLIIERGKNAINLLQPDTLIEKLSQSYTVPSPEGGISVRVDREGQALLDALSSLSVQLKAPIVATGLSSVSQYAVMQREGKLSVYCPLDQELASALPLTTSASRFPNLEIIASMDPTVYFDAQKIDGFLWASPVQTFLELMHGDKRDQETGEEIKKSILRKIGKTIS
jgi:hypothetical protein